MRRLGELRSIFPSTIKAMALTATATSSTRKDIIKILCMMDEKLIYLPPTKTNIVILLRLSLINSQK